MSLSLILRGTMSRGRGNNLAGLESPYKSKLSSVIYTMLALRGIIGDFYYGFVLVTPTGLKLCENCGRRFRGSGDLCELGAELQYS